MHIHGVKLNTRLVPLMFYIYPFVISTLIFSQFSIFIFLIKQRFSILNKLLYNLFFNENNTNNNNNNNKNLQIINIKNEFNKYLIFYKINKYRQIKMIYSELCDILKNFNRIFQISILILIGIAFVQLTVILYRIYISSQFFDKYDNFVWYLLITLKTLMVLQFSEDTRIEVSI